MIRPSVIVIAGPDGVGKSSVAEALKRELLPSPVLHLHHRPGVLPRSAAAKQATTEPHASTPYSVAKSAAKIVFLWADYLLGWAFRLAPFRSRGGFVILERGWMDLSIDPRRYRLRELQLSTQLGRLLPRPDLTVILLAEPEVLLARVRELPIEEIVRQSSEWRAYSRLDDRTIVLDASRSISEAVGTIVQTLSRAT